MTIKSAREFFEQAAARGYAAGLQGVRGTYRFDIEGAGSFHVVIDDGAVGVQEAGVDADCVMQCDEEEFLRLLRGEQNALTAFMQGRLRIEGDTILAQKFHALLPESAERPAAEQQRRAS